MATTSEIKTGLDAIAAVISAQRQSMKSIKTNAAGVSGELANLPTAYSDVIGTVQAFASDTTDAFEKNAKAELAKLTTEFTALKSVADAVKNANLG